MPTVVEIDGWVIRAVIGDDPDVVDPRVRVCLREDPRIADDPELRDAELHRELQKNLALDRAGRLRKRRRSSPGRPQKCEPLIERLRADIAAGRTSRVALQARGPSRLAKELGVSRDTMTRVLRGL